jgi:serine/threonine protein phosphatase PrpC
MQVTKVPSDINVHKTSICGRRLANEDEELVVRNLSMMDEGPINSQYAPIDLFIICDGHGGSQVAKFVVPQLQKFFCNKSLVYPLKDTYIHSIFNHIQQKLKSHPNNIADECGSTALVLIRYIFNKKKCIQVINLGDCRAVLARSGFAIPLSKDHKPEWTDEKIRIRNINKAYGTNEKIYFDEEAWRIGNLSVSRSFGDLDNVPYVTHIPEIFNYCLHAIDDEFIIMACDGLWDVIRNEEAINFVRDHLRNNYLYTYNILNQYPPPDHKGINKKSEENIARKLAEYAKAKDSTDNISILIIIFN